MAGGDYEMLELGSKSTSTQTMTITSRLIAILSSIPRRGLSVETSPGGVQSAPIVSRRIRSPVSTGATDGSRCSGRRGRSTAWHPDPNRCYLTVTQPYWLKNAKCGVMLHRIR